MFSRSQNLMILLSVLFSASLAFVAPGAKLATTSRRTEQPTPVWGSRKSSLDVTTRDDLVMMPATIEREKVKVGGPAVLDRPQVERKQSKDDPTRERKAQGHEAWEVRIYNDGLNTREHVARSLVQVTGMSEISAYQTMMQAHQNGIAVVGRYFFEIAEMYQDALRKQGIVCDIVPVEEEK